ncbi:MAG: hypothetical protein Hyperionvirus2_182 [Hyperionvirus sp.]|uniref:Uncharacterized protein n=1 Tax=Hyperionvirus sp. TaxID=2487770 RepID=A0A3G5A8I2_9VIRU|nr:MAG: hypothetical protein Hyperionvirus2_182 [Hyperionvirus sp.]
MYEYNYEYFDCPGDINEANSCVKNKTLSQSFSSTIYYSCYSHFYNCRFRTSDELRNNYGTAFLTLTYFLGIIGLIWACVILKIKPSRESNLITEATYIAVPS